MQIRRGSFNFVGFGPSFLFPGSRWFPVNTGLTAESPDLGGGHACLQGRQIHQGVKLAGLGSGYPPTRGSECNSPLEAKARRNACRKCQLGGVATGYVSIGGFARRSSGA